VAKGNVFELGSNKQGPIIWPITNPYTNQHITKVRESETETLTLIFHSESLWERERERR
jgi:hypothetical protein